MIIVENNKIESIPHNDLNTYNAMQNKVAFLYSMLRSVSFNVILIYNLFKYSSFKVLNISSQCSL